MRHVATALAVALLVSTTACGITRSRWTTYEPFTTDLGVLVQDLTVPLEGAIAEVGDTVTIDYEMRLEDRTVIDSTKMRGQPISFVLGRGLVPLGIEEGLVGMRRLGQRDLTIPPSLAYGEEGRPPDIPPHAVLHVRVELLEIEPAEGPESATEASE